MVEKLNVPKLCCQAQADKVKLGNELFQADPAKLKAETLKAALTKMITKLKLIVGQAL